MSGPSLLSQAYFFSIEMSYPSVFPSATSIRSVVRSRSLYSRGTVCFSFPANLSCSTSSVGSDEFTGEPSFMVQCVTATLYLPAGSRAIELFGTADDVSAFHLKCVATQAVLEPGQAAVDPFTGKRSAGTSSAGFSQSKHTSHRIKFPRRSSRHALNAEALIRCADLLERSLPRFETSPKPPELVLILPHGVESFGTQRERFFDQRGPAFRRDQFVPFHDF